MDENSGSNQAFAVVTKNASSSAVILAPIGPSSMLNVVVKGTGGITVGTGVGRDEGLTVGFEDLVGETEGSVDGAFDGDLEGSEVGSEVGERDGSFEGVGEGMTVGGLVQRPHVTGQKSLASSHLSTFLSSSLPTQAHVFC